MTRSMGDGAADVIVVGSGPSGLAAAFRLDQAGYQVRMLERDAVVGGKLRSSRRDGYVIDHGALLLPTTHTNMLGIAAEAGFGDLLRPGGFVLGMHRDGRVHELDGDHLVRDFLRTPALSRRAKLQSAHLLPEVLRARRATFDGLPEVARYDTDSVDGWAREHLAPEVAEYVVGTMMRGMFNCDLRLLPRVDFLAIVAFFLGARLAAYPGGMSDYSERIAARFDVRTGATVTSVEETSDGVEVVWSDADGVKHTDHAAGCVLAVPAATTLELHPALDSWRREHMTLVKRGRSVVVTLALARAPRDIRATYVMTSPPSHPFVVGVVFDHNKASGRAPDGKGLLTVTTLSEWFEAHQDADDATLSELVVDAVDGLLPGTGGDVEFTAVHRWDQEFSRVGYYREIGRFRSVCETADRRIQLAGDYHSSQNLNAATCAGERAARLLRPHLERVG